VRIRNTLELTNICVSPNLLDGAHKDIEVMGPAVPVSFNAQGNLD
jgi:hypothetical protein